MASLLALASTLYLLALSTAAEPLSISDYQVSASLLDVLQSNVSSLPASSDGSSPYTYPTDLTRGIVPKALHSHNDYWRDRPFWSALSVGAISVEADVWYINSTLYVGHELQALTPSRTFHSLYVEPILSVLHAQNPATQFSSGSKNGVFDTDSSQTLYLWVDCKTDGHETFDAVVQALEPLRQGGWLTNYTGPAEGGAEEPESVQTGAVTVIGTGNTPLDLVQGVAPRDYFYDADLSLLGTTLSNITAAVTPIASTQFTASFALARNGTFNATQLDLLDAQIGAAKDKGIMARYWDTPGWPVSTRRGVWEVLWDRGVGLVNVDDLEDAAFNF